MKLKDCKHGIIVTDKEGEKIGMIVGITSNCPGASMNQREKPEFAIPLVKWSGRFEPVGVHHGNIKPYKGDL